MDNEVRKSAETLRHSDVTLRTLLESPAQAILAVNANGAVLIANNIADKMFGYNPNELVGQSIVGKPSKRANHSPSRCPPLSEGIPGIMRGMGLTE